MEERTLKRHAAKFQKDQYNWGYAGELEHVVETLDGIIEDIIDK